MIDEKIRVTNEPFVDSPPLVIERDDGKFGIGFHDDAAGPFPTRHFAEAVRLRGSRHQAPSPRPL